MEYLIKSSALLILMYLGYTLFLKKETFFIHNRWYLMLGILTAIVLPLIEIPVYIPVEKTITNITPLQFEYTPTELVIEDTSFDWIKIATYIYGIGVIIFFIQFLFQFGSLIILLLKNSKNKEGIYTYVIVKNKISPFSFFKWIVYNPKLFSENELQLILNHEKVHVRQWHSVDIIISRLTCVAFWFNPLSWFYHKNIQQNLEYIADNEVNKTSLSQKTYQQLLLKTSIGDTNIHLTSNFYNSLIKKRIVMLQKEPSRSINRLKSIFVIPFFILFLMSFNTKEVYIESIIQEQGKTSVTTSSIEVLFSTKTTDKSLEDIKKKLEAEGVNMIIREKLRNADGLLTTLNLTFESEGSSTNYWANDKNGIKPFYFKKASSGAISVGPVEIIEVVEEPEVLEIIEVEEEPIIEIIEEEQEDQNNSVKSKVIYKLRNLTKEKAENGFKISSDSVIVVKGSPLVTGVYALNTKDTIVIGKSVNIKGNTKVHSNVYTIKADSINFKNKIRVSNTSGKNPIYVLNGKVISKKDVKKLNPNNLKTFSVLKDKSAISLYGKSAKDGAIIMTTNAKSSKKKGPWNFEISKVEAFQLPNSSIEEAEAFMQSSKKPLIIMNNEILGNIDASGLDARIIKELSIVKGKKAVEMYGTKGKNGAVIIFTNDEYERSEKERRAYQQKYTSEVTAIGYTSDENPEEKMVLYFISKMTPNSLIDKHINQLKSVGISAKVSKLKRNKSGDIVKIKISLKDDKGNSSSATFENKSGIPTVNFGKQDGNLVVSSNKF